MNKNPTVIQLKNIHKTFREHFHILKGISVDFPPGGLTYVLGPSGTGKSVMLKHILGLMLPDQGEILIDGINITNHKGSALKNHRTKFGVLFQNSALFDNMTVFENVAFPLIEHTDLSKNEIYQKVSSTLSLLGMKEGYDKFPDELSGGMKKRVGLARAIIREPSILLYDEPTTGLDPVTRKTVDDLIDQLKRELKLTSIVISHDIPSALRLADKILFLSEGHIAFFGSPEGFIKNHHPTIQEFLKAEMSSASTFMRFQN